MFSLHFSQIVIQICKKDSCRIILSLLGFTGKSISWYVGRTMKTVEHIYQIQGILSVIYLTRNGKQRSLIDTRLYKKKILKNPVSVDTVGHSLVGGARETEKVIFCCNILWGECMHKVMCLCTFTLQVLNSLGDKFSH